MQIARAWQLGVAESRLLFIILSYPVPYCQIFLRGFLSYALCSVYYGIYADVEKVNARI